MDTQVDILSTELLRYRYFWKVAWQNCRTLALSKTAKTLNIKDPGEGPSRGLLRDSKTSRNLRDGSFEALDL